MVVIKQEVKIILQIIAILAVSLATNFATYHRVVAHSLRETTEYDSKYLYQLANKDQRVLLHLNDDQPIQQEQNDEIMEGQSQHQGSKVVGLDSEESQKKVSPVDVQEVEQSKARNSGSHQRTQRNSEQQLQILDDFHTNETPTSIQCNEEILDVHGSIHSKRDVEILTGMAEKNLCLSYKHQKKFVMLKDKVLSWIHSRSEKEKKFMYSGVVGKLGYAYVLNEKYAFRHIFKNGGSTVLAVTRGSVETVDSKELQERSLVSVVRDPIEHFLSGWAECGSRLTNPKDYTWFTPDKDLNKRLRKWLKNIEGCMTIQKAERSAKCKCINHSYPQASFLLDPESSKGRSFLTLAT